uniref:Uncharacterized protein n=1 Tax=Romanomermis culicivorax TaxID=13658 RepID=A0A915KML2_ROMCU
MIGIRARPEDSKYLLSSDVRRSSDLRIIGYPDTLFGIYPIPLEKQSAVINGTKYIRIIEKSQNT